MSRNPFIDEADFLRGYLECALWSSNDPDTEEPLDSIYGIDDIDPETREVAREDCAVFGRALGYKLMEFGKMTGRDDASLGHDFWLTRNGHGAGYWDRYLETESGSDRDRVKALGEELSEKTNYFGAIDLMPIGNGKIGA